MTATIVMMSAALDQKKWRNMLGKYVQLYDRIFSISTYKIEASATLTFLGGMFHRFTFP